MADYNKDVLLILSGGRNREVFLQTIHKTGVRLHCYDKEVTWAAPYVKSWIIGSACPKFSLKKIKESIEKENLHFDGILCYDEYGLLIASHVAEGLGLSFVKEQDLVSMRMKDGFRKRCIENNIWVPKNALLENPLKGNELDEWIKDKGLNFPLILKPTLGCGKWYVSRVDNIDQLKSALDEFFLARENQVYTDRWISDGSLCTILLEELMEGIELDVDAVIQDSKILMLSLNLNKPTKVNFMEAGGLCPACLPNDQEEMIRDLLEKVISAFNDKLSCVVHFEVMVIDEGKRVFPIEINMRAGNAETYMMVKTAYDTDLALASINLALGIRPACQSSNFTGRYCSSLNFVPQGLTQSGWITLQDLPLDVLQSPNYVAHKFYYQVDQYVPLPSNGNHYLGWIVATSTVSAEDAEVQCQRLCDMIKFEMRFEEKK